MNEQNLAQTEAREVDRFSMADPAVASCPHAYYAAMRRDEPVHRDPGTGFYWVALHDAVVKGAMDPQALSSKSPVILKKSFRPLAQALWDAAGMQALDTLVTSDPPEHEHYRAVGMSLFTPKKVEELAPHIEARVEELIAAPGDRREIEFVGEFAAQLPGTIVCDEFGFPREDQQRFKHWIEAIFGLMVPGISDDEEVVLVKRLIELFRYLEAHLDRAAAGPSGRVLHALATMPRRDGKPFTMLERGWLAVTTFVGGNDTTIGMLASGVRRLCADPALQQQLRADPALTPKFIEELLRLESSVQALLRVSTRDVEIGGVTIPKGANVVLCTASANRDDARWQDADRFRIDRPDGRRHLGFGHGIHACIGMHLARRELQIAFDLILQRWDDLQLAIPDHDVEQLPLPFHRGIARLPIRFNRRGS